MVDLHSHILPCFDDGSKSYEETLKLIKMEADDGVTTIALTPHFIFGHSSALEFSEKRNKAFKALKNTLYGSDTNIRIITGAEVLLSPEILNEKNLKELCYEDTDFMLVEFPINYYRNWIPHALYKLKLQGITPVIAHIERYPYIIRHPEIIFDIVSSGSITQVNADSLIYENHRMRSFISILIKHNLLHIVATDTHSVESRPPRLNAAMQAIEKKYGKAAADYIIRNSEDILCNSEPDLLEPIRIRKKFLCI